MRSADIQRLLARGALPAWHEIEPSSTRHCAASSSAWGSVWVRVRVRGLGLGLDDVRVERPRDVEGAVRHVVEARQPLAREACERGELWAVGASLDHENPPLGRARTRARQSGEGYAAAGAVSSPSVRFCPPLVVSPGKSRSARGAMRCVKAASTWSGLGLGLGVELA